MKSLLFLLLVSCSEQYRNLDSVLLRAKSYKDREVCIFVPQNNDGLDGEYCIYYNNKDHKHKAKVDLDPSFVKEGR